MKIMSFLRHENGFTLIEMLIVLMIISILLMIAVPNMSKSNKVVKEKSCEATIKLVQSQVAAYNVANNANITDLGVLQTDGYVDTLQCPDGGTLTLDAEGKVVKGS